MLIFGDLSGAKDCKTCRSREMLKNAPTLAIVAVHTAENEPLKISLVHFISSIVSLVPPRIGHDERVCLRSLRRQRLRGRHRRDALHAELNAALALKRIEEGRVPRRTSAIAFPMR